ncbi:hypothetical protein M408DRAFT_223588 [Serendipita vermifera MAFF 305830]|uniref:Inner centromere protein ARK-binding domain-containing protein n=1 Tax=Serendipita vermifera MAFF 305830 TaxID=933852 RepID=A0A0C3B0T4_SERVB|nr:hypothetical protein M408DRAFT_223588 [Serendipita vermifera MAFF 305830]
MAQSTSYNPPPRPFLRPPSPSSLPSAEQHGLTGADAWAYNVSTRLMSDPGRWDLFNQVQAGMVWLDEYMKEIEDMIVKDDEEVDFVELVKTPGRNKASQSHYNSTANAEKLAKINALHFGEEANDKPKAAKPLEKHAQGTVLPPSNTNNTLRPAHDELHVVSHTPATPTPLAQEVPHPATTKAATTIKLDPQPQPTAPQPQQQQRPTDAASQSVMSTASVSSASGTSRASVAGATNSARFGPRPLPTVPNGMRSRTASNASVMQQQPIRPPSRTANPVDVQPKVMDFVDQPRSQPAQPAQPEAPKQPAKAKETSVPPAPRTPSPAPIESDEMDVEVEVPLNDTTISKPSGPIFPTSTAPLTLSRKPSFAALPNPSPMRKSVRGDATTPHTRVSTATGAPGQRTSGWFKGTTPAAATTSEKKSVEKGAAAKMVAKVPVKLDTDEKTAANTAANAALGAVPVVPVASTAAAKPAAPKTNTLKRKSDVLGETATSGTESAGEERASKSTKKAGQKFAMERDEEDEDVDGDDGQPHDDDTAERLLKLRGMLKAGGVADGAPGPVSVEKPRSRVDSRPDQFKPVSRIATALGDDASKGKPGDEKKTKIAKPAIVSPLKVSELVGAWEKKGGEASPGADKRAATFPKFAPHAAAALVSTTPPDSPVVKKTITATATTKTSVKTLERVPSSSNAFASGSIFKAPPAKTNIFTAPTAKPASQATAKAPSQATTQGIFTRPASQQYNGGVSSQQSQSTTTSVTDEDSLFELAGKKGKTSTSTYDTGSQPSQEPFRAKEREPSGAMWGMEEGLTAGWLSKGNDTLGENAARQRAQSQEEDEDDEGDQAFVDDDDVTNQQAVAAIMARAMAESQGVNRDEEEDERDESDGDDEMAVDSQDEEPEAENEDDMMEEEEEEEQAPPPAPVPAPTSGGIFAHVGSLASKAAQGLASLRYAAAAAEKEKIVQEKRDTKAKEAEARRLAIQQKKAEEGTKKREEAERKRKAEEERRRKEKADTTLNRSIKAKPAVRAYSWSKNSSDASPGCSREEAGTQEGSFEDWSNQLDSWTLPDRSALDFQACTYADQGTYHQTRWSAEPLICCCRFTFCSSTIQCTRLHPGGSRQANRRKSHVQEELYDCAQVKLDGRR